MGWLAAAKRHHLVLSPIKDLFVVFSSEDITGEDDCWLHCGQYVSSLQILTEAKLVDMHVVAVAGASLRDYDVDVPTMAGSDACHSDVSVGL